QRAADFIVKNDDRYSWLQEVHDLDENSKDATACPENPQISNTNISTIHTIQNTLTPQIITTRGTNSTSHVQPARIGIGAVTSEIIVTPVTRMKVSTTNPQISGIVDTFAHSSAAILPASQSYNNSSNTSIVSVVTRRI
ncbi:11517_t:CDS:2, partial [Funneliformis geosporum]